MKKALSRFTNEDIVAEVLRRIGENPKREGLRDTPKRIVKSWNEIYAGYKIDPETVLGTTFDSESYDEIIFSNGIDFFSTCEHHGLPFYGVAHVAYLPSVKASRVVGYSKIARLVDVYARRMQIQERLTRQVAMTMEKVLKPRGVAVVMEAAHLCARCRGVRKPNGTMRTQTLTGVFKTDIATRAEFFASIPRSQ